MSALGWLRGMFGAGTASVRASAGDGGVEIDISDPNFAAQLRGGAETESGVVMTPLAALRVSAAFRCIDLISSAVGRLPAPVIRVLADGTLTTEVNHPLYWVLMHEPNGWQTPFEFKSTMQARALLYENAFALAVWSMGRVIRLIPLDPHRVRVEQMPDYSVRYHYSRPDGGVAIFTPQEILHLRGTSVDGLNGLSRTRYAKEALGLALKAEQAAANLFKNGQITPGAFQFPEHLSPEAYQRLQEGMASRRAGGENAGRHLILEEGGTVAAISSSAVDNQHLETRQYQVEEVARAFGVPRPLLMVDETSWGSGIEQLATMFVRFGLAPWFTVWEEALARCALTREERRAGYRVDFDEQELLRGSMKDQADFFSKALGAGGRGGWLTKNEARRATGFSPLPGGDDLPSDAMPSAPVPPPATQEDPSNEPQNPA
ncbi:phage portal protein [Ancylobacter vacuolatus]|uniref:HK97 family phage portal protein n=1 Tax=Ancylobacter vacuolatus TaxID=223389 RepID=A0ABU0DMX9_9HYPH|nr:phage portal protein [Ancylobacter vacuolatus]MDQ0349745.1 HK97 family phage portal protein [Ancylobacter vacuolatus]